MKYIKIKCEKTECPAHHKCCFLPTEIDPTPDNRIHILFVGQGGGSVEREEKRPFMGVAGKRLRFLVESIREKSKEPLGVAYSNVIRDNPDFNRVPAEMELKSCLPFLFRDIKGLQKLGLKVIIPLGNAAKLALIEGAPKIISKDHGILYQVPHDECGVLSMVPTYHPSYLIRMSRKLDVRRLPKFDALFIKDLIKAIKYARTNSTFE